MSVQFFGTLEVFGYSVAIILLLVTITFYFTKHVHEVHDELVGKTARDAIAELRSGKVAVPRSEQVRAGRQSVFAADESASGSLHVRFMEKDTQAKKQKTAGTSLSHPSAPNTEDITTLISKSANEDMTVSIGQSSTETVTSPLMETPTEDITTLFEGSSDAIHAAAPSDEVEGRSHEEA